MKGGVMKLTKATVPIESVPGSPLLMNRNLPKKHYNDFLDRVHWVNRNRGQAGIPWKIFYYNLMDACKTTKMDKAFVRRGVRILCPDILPITYAEIRGATINVRKNKELELKIESERKQVVEMENKAVERMLLTIKFRDQETGEHLNRISHLVYILSKDMGLDEELSTNIAKASKLHDIGKVGIPDSILYKEGKLNEEEWRIMKGHTVIGERILSVGESELLKLAGLIARSHHENWDGTGYPSGLVGEQIPISGRIMAVTDVFDALLSDRPYKKAWDIESAIEFVRDECGKKFDPAIVKKFLKNIDKIVSMYNGSTQTKMLII